MGPRVLLSLFSSLVLTASAAACTTTVIEQHAAPTPAPEDAGGIKPGAQPPDPDGGTDGSTGPFVFKPAPDGTFAQAVSAGGSVVKSPKVVPIVFAADPDKQSIADFTAKLATSTYWGKISSEYGVGALTAKTPIILQETAPTTIDDSQVSSWLTNKFTTDAAHFGAPDSDTLYAIFYPATTTITQGGAQSCVEFGGYHFETTAGGKNIGYTVVPRCSGFAGLNGMDVTTFSASHEVLEWATDPFPASRPAYMSVDDDHSIWGRVFLGELGDLCTQMDAEIVPADLGFTVQRTWSNASAKAGHHPCAPTTTTPYFTVFPTKLDKLPVIDAFGNSITTRGIKVGVGESKTIDLTMYSDAAMPSGWTVSAFDLTKISGGGTSPEFSYSLDKSKGTSGDTLHLTITGERPAHQGQGVVLVSQSAKATNLWPIWIMN